MHNCRLWTALGVSCPGGLLAAAERAPQGGGGDGAVPIPEDEVHERAEQPVAVPRDGFELERQVLLELNRRVQAERGKSSRQKTVERLLERDRVAGRPRIPVELMREAARQGMRGPEATAAIAAALLALAAGGAALAIPGTVRAIAGAARGVGGVGFRFNANARMNELMQTGVRRLFPSGFGPGHLPGGGGPIL